MIFEVGTVPEPPSAVVLMIGLITTSAVVLRRRLL
jgi:hypothetical protein